MNETFRIKFVGYLLIVPFMVALYYTMKSVFFSVDTYIDWSNGKVSAVLCMSIILVIVILLIWLSLHQRLLFLNEQLEHIQSLRDQKIEFNNSIEPLKREYKMKQLSVEDECRKKIDSIQNECRGKILTNDIKCRMKILEKKKEFQEILNGKKREFDSRILELENSHQLQVKQLEKALEKMKCLIESKTPFRDVSIIMAELKTAIYDELENYLRIKTRPAIKAADTVKDIKDKFRSTLIEYKSMKYKYDFVVNLFPEIKEYIDDDESLVQIEQYSSLSEIDENTDRVKFWLEDDEYNSMSEDERNQLALDRYKERPKSNWEIGIEYELFIGYLLREGLPPFNKKYEVVQFGELNGVQDLGRDIIAETNDEIEGKKIFIIQCKRWSDDKQIHENAICQLFGTAMEYQIRNNLKNCKYIPLFVTTTKLSDMAVKFAEILNVKVLQIPMGDYPMIKCNVNGTMKIYHLPFDQQYHRTIIQEEGEFYARTVKEAVSKGFRRAMRHIV